MSVRVLIVGLVAVIVAPPMLLAGMSGGSPETTALPRGAALGDIPAQRIALYTASAERFQIDWALLAAIGKLECNHGRSRLAGCAPQGSVNAAGATGPMQFLGPTWRAGIGVGSVPPPAAPTTDDGEGYATDGDGDGVADVWDAADAIAAAARMLAANGAAANERRALLAFNHSSAYADETLAIAAHYRALAAETSVPAGADPVGWALQWLGTAYVYGGNHGNDPLDPASLPRLTFALDGRTGYFDCSSLTSWAFAKTTGIWIGGTAEQQWQQAQTTPGALSGGDEPPPGGFQRDDLVWTQPDFSHVGLVATPVLLLNAPRTGRDVSLDPLAGRTIYAWARYPAATGAPA